MVDSFVMTKRINIGDDELILETGQIARQSDGAVIVRQGNAAILVTVVSSETARDGIDFFPLTVDYRELFGAAGIIPRSYNRREGRLSDHEILSCRIIDRSIRPLFPDGYRNDTQVIATLLSADKSIDTDVLGLFGACAAINISSIPFNGPAAGLRLCRIDGKFVINPRRDRRKIADIDLVISGGRSGVVMMEGHCSNVPEADILKALEYAHEKINEFLDVLDDWRSEKNVVSREFIPELLPSDVFDHARLWIDNKLSEALSHEKKQTRYAAIDALKKKYIDHISETIENPEIKLYEKAFNKLKAEVVRNRMFREKIRLDNRSPEDIRPITGAVNWLATPHGSALFTRGETQACVTCTLGPERDLLKLQTVYGDSESTFFLHYSFPPYSVGEVRPVRGPGRREIGHGTLAWRALLQVVPDRNLFPYTVRIFSEITESNGSSSMATICGGCLSLMDAGVPISAPVAGIAMGLIAENDEYLILSDILGDEDHMGDMDFKVAGTSSGVTAIQMDNKIGNLSPVILGEALSQARKGLNHILGEMKKIYPEVRSDLKAHSPRSEEFYIRQNKIGLLIGPSGKTIKDIQARTETTIEIKDDGCVRIFAGEKKDLDSARREVEFLTREPKLNAYYRGKVKSIKPFGAFVEIMPNTEGLVHVSELGVDYVDDPGKVVRVGETIPVKLIGVDNGKIKLSRREALNISDTLFEE